MVKTCHFFAGLSVSSLNQTLLTNGKNLTKEQHSERSINVSQWSQSASQLCGPGFVDETNSSRKETVLVVSGFGPDGAQPPARGEFFQGPGVLANCSRSTFTCLTAVFYCELAPWPRCPARQHLRHRNKCFMTLQTFCL